MSDGEPERGKGHREGQFGAELVQRQVGGFGQEGPNRVVVRSEFGRAGRGAVSPVSRNRWWNRRTQAGLTSKRVAILAVGSPF